MKIVWLLLFLPLSLFSQTKNWQEIKLSSETETPLNITSNMEIFTDSTAKLPFEKIISENFKKHQKDYFTFPFSDNIYWVRLTFNNSNATNKNWVLRWDNALVEKLDFYLSDTLNKNFRHTPYQLLTKEKLKKLYEEEPHFAFDLVPNSTKILYIKLTSKRGHYGNLTLFSDATFTHFRYDNFAGQGINNGLIIFRLMLVIILCFFIIKDSVFKAYSVQIILKSAAFWGIQNILGPIFTNVSSRAIIIDILSLNSTAIGSSIFVLWAFPLNKLPKATKFFFYFFIANTIFLNGVICIDYEWYWIKAGVVNMVTCTSFVVLLYIYCIYKKLPTNYYYSIPFVLGIVSFLLFNIRLLSGIEFKGIGVITVLLFLGEIFIFILFLGRIIRNVELKKIAAEQNLNFNLEQNVYLKEIDNLKTTFFTNISHELRTPLTLITAPIQELIAKYPSDSLLPIMHRNAQRLLTLINQLLDISKLEAGQMKVEMSENDIAKYLKTLASSFTSLAESKKIDFQFVQNNNEVLGYIDKDKLDKIITNLLSNAFKFTPEGRKVSITSNFSGDNKNLEIQIGDTGVGIEKAQLDKIFDRFYKIEGSQNRNYEGTGIGLALVKELVGVLKGKISVISEKNIGTTFIVTFPVDFETWKDNISDTLSPADLTSISSPKEGVNAPLFFGEEMLVRSANDNILLIVDDNADIRAYIRSIFEPTYQIIEAINGKDGIVQAQETTPNIIISDLMMPEMDGFEFCKYLKTNETTSHIPVIMLTAKADIKSRIEGFKLGADDYLIKPFNTQEIQVRVKNLLEKQEKLRNYFEGNNSEIITETINVNPIEIAFLNKANAIIEKHLSENSFGVEQLSQEMNMSQSQLLRKLKALTNQTTVEFIRDFRLQKAAELLTNNTVSEVAFQVGFESLSYFAKAFQEKFSVLPSEYKTP